MAVWKCTLVTGCYGFDPVCLWSVKLGLKSLCGIHCTIQARSFRLIGGEMRYLCKIIALINLEFMKVFYSLKSQKVV